MNDAIRRMIDCAAGAKEPAETFCQMISELPEEGRQQVLDVCALALGCSMDVADEDIDLEKAVRKAYGPAELADIQRKLVALTTKHHVRPEMLLPGLFDYVRKAVGYAATGTASNAAIDTDLDWLSKMEAYKKAPANERPAGFETDEAIERAIQAIQAKAAARPALRDAARQVFEQLDDAWNRHFPTDYWQKWLDRMVELS